MRNEESAIQQALVMWLRYNYPNALFTIAPNGFKLPIGVAVKMKKMGYSKGTPDIMIFEPKDTYHGLFIELKTEKGRVSPEQDNWRVALNWRNYRAIVCYSYDEATKMIDEYFGKEVK